MYKRQGQVVDGLLCLPFVQFQVRDVGAAALGRGGRLLLCLLVGRQGAVARSLGRLRRAGGALDRLLGRSQGSRVCLRRGLQTRQFVLGRAQVFIGPRCV